MLTAHLPSGYVAARAFSPRLTWALPVALVAAILPDIDLIWFYLIDERAFHHHKYWVHVPFFWAVIALMTWPFAKRAGKAGLFAVFFGVIALHLFLDTIVGGIAWAMPFSDHLFHFFEVPALRGHWTLNFILHWTFLFEVLVWATALLFLIRERRS